MMDRGENPCGTVFRASHGAGCGNLSLAPKVHCSLESPCPSEAWNFFVALFECSSRPLFFLFASC